MTEHQNFILASLGERERTEFLAGATEITLEFGHTVLRPDEVVSHVYFPERGVISIIAEATSGQAAEAGVTGSEGAAGLPEALGSGVMRSRGVVQAAGVAWRVRALSCRSLYSTSDRFRWATAKAAEFQAVEARQSLLCRSHHVLDQRLARWLLEMAERDNARSPSLPLTQEILSVMLAVQRTSVTAAATSFRKAGLISYSRGQIILEDVEGLEKIACECRTTVRNAEAEILGRERARLAQLC